MSDGVLEVFVVDSQLLAVPSGLSGLLMCAFFRPDVAADHPHASWSSHVKDFTADVKGCVKTRCSQFPWVSSVLPSGSAGVPIRVH